MYRSVVRLLLWAYGIFFGSMLICIIVEPNGLRINDGMSYFGVHWITFVPYGISLLIPAALLFLASQQLLKRRRLELIFRYAFVLMSISLVILFLTPYSFGKMWDYTHTAAGTTLFGTQFLLILYWIIACRPKLFDYAVFIVMLAFGLASAFYLPTNYGFLTQTQLVFQIAFAVWIVQTFKLEYRKINKS